MQGRLLVGCMAAATLLGCSRAMESADPADSAPPYLTVVNDQWLDVAIYGVRGTSRFRLGTAPALGQVKLRLPAGLMPDGTVQLLADPIGSSTTYLSDPIVVGTGQHVELRLASQISMSSFAVWNR